MLLEIKNVNKSFNKTHILKDVSFQVQSGRGMGFLGRNGAGKTTTIRSLMNIFKADSGEFLIDGEKLDRNKYKIGYLPEERGMYQKIKLIDQLVYFGELKGMSKKEAKESALKLLERVELSDYANKKLETLSKGNQQKVQIIQAILNDPDIVIFDEPFSGLDPVNARVLKDIIIEYIKKDRIVLFSSHQMGLVEEFCDDITLIKKGQIMMTGDLDDIKEEIGQRKYVISTTDDEAFEKLEAIPSIISVKKLGEDILVEIKEEDRDNTLLKSIVNSGIQVESFKPYRPSLEELFIKVDKEN